MNYYVNFLEGIGSRHQWISHTGKPLSEALIFASTNPQYDDRLFIDLPLQYEKNTSSDHVVYKNCFKCQNKNNKQLLHKTCS